MERLDRISKNEDVTRVVSKDFKFVRRREVFSYNRDLRYGKDGFMIIK